MRAYRYLEHMADMGIETEGDTLEEAFIAGAEGMFSLMVGLDAVRGVETVSVSAMAADIPGLFVAWLNELLAQKDIAGLVFSHFAVTRFENTNGAHRLEGSASGEPFDPERHIPKLEVKAATYYGLQYEQRDGKHVLRCVLDV